MNSCISLKKPINSSIYECLLLNFKKGPIRRSTNLNLEIRIKWFFEKIPDNIFCIFWQYKNNFKIFSQLSKKYKYLKNIFSVFEKIQIPKKYFLDFWKNIFEKIIFFRLQTEKIFFFIFSRLKWKHISELLSRWDIVCPALVPLYSQSRAIWYDSNWTSVYSYCGRCWR